jgi:hypothetical protein
MKGFVITLISVSLIMIIVLLAITVHNEQLKARRAVIEPLPLLYSAFYFDSVAIGLNEVVGPRMVLLQSNNSTTISITDTLESENHSLELDSFETFISTEIATRTQSNISLNFTNISQGVNRVFINEDYNYTNSHIDNESVFTRKGGVPGRSYIFEYTIGAVRTNSTPMTLLDNATANITIIYTDLNGTVNHTGSINIDQSNVEIINYGENCQIRIEVGPILGNGGSYSVKSSNCEVEYSATMELDQISFEKKLGYQYDAIMNYTQGKVSKITRIGK